VQDAQRLWRRSSSFKRRRGREQRDVVMRSSDHYTWELKSPQSVAGDPVETALGLEEAKLSCGPCVFDFVRAHSPRGELVLILTPDGGTPSARRPAPICHREHEQVIPPAPAYLRAEARKRLEARYVQVLGRALFDDVAHLIKLEMRFP
jgi:hypothetical protein